MTTSKVTDSVRERNKRRRTDQILESVLVLIREEPERLPTVERIAARAGVSAMTVFNLVGTRDGLWKAAVSHALRGLDLTPPAGQPAREQALHIVDASVLALVGDAGVFRGLLATWRGDVLRDHDPTAALIRCFESARVAGDAGDIDAALYAEVVATGLLGAINQWTAGLLDDGALRARAVSLVEVAFRAAASDA